MATAAPTMYTTIYRWPYGPTPIQLPAKPVSPAVAALLPSITINMPAPPVPETPVQSGAPAAVAAQEGWLSGETSGISNKLLVAGAVIAALYFMSKK